MTLTSVLVMTVLGQVVLPGNNLGLEEAQSKARIVVVAKLVRTHITVGVGAISVSDVDLKHTLILKGEVKTALLERASVSASGHETLPEEGEEYIFFINDYAKHLNILKVLPKTDENLAAVRKEIKAKDKP